LTSHFVLGKLNIWIISDLLTHLIKVARDLNNQDECFGNANRVPTGTKTQSYQPGKRQYQVSNNARIITILLVHAAIITVSRLSYLALIYLYLIKVNCVLTDEIIGVVIGAASLASRPLDVLLS